MSLKTFIVLAPVLLAAGITAADEKPNKLEAAVAAGPKVRETNSAAARPGEKPDGYASPGREKHGKGLPPGLEKKPEDPPKPKPKP